MILINTNTQNLPSRSREQAMPSSPELPAREAVEKRWCWKAQQISLERGPTGSPAGEGSLQSRPQGRPRSSEPPNLRPRPSGGKSVSFWARDRMRRSEPRSLFFPRCLCTIPINFNENYICTLKQDQFRRNLALGCIFVISIKGTKPQGSHAWVPKDRLRCSA